MPEGSTFAYNTQYTASVNIKLLEDSYKLSVRKVGETEYKTTNFVVFPDSEMKVSFNGSTEGVGLDFANLAVSKTFPATKYELAAVNPPDDITDVPFVEGYTPDKIAEMIYALPPTRIVMKGGAELDASIRWGTISQERIAPGPDDKPDYWSGSIWTVPGTVVLPSGVENPDEVSLDFTLTITVDDAGDVAAPIVATEQGIYKVKAHLNDSTDYWETDDADDRTQDDQEIIFVIVDGKTHDKYIIGAIAQPTEGGTVSGTGSYALNDQATVTATPNDGYAFVSWTPFGSEEVISTNASYAYTVVQSRLFVANFARILTVRWIDGDGETVLQEETYLEGKDEPAYTGNTPTRESKQEYTYTFTGWDEGRTSDTVKTYNAQFAATLNKYTVTFVDYDDTVLSQASYDYGTPPSGITVPDDPTRDGYKFTGWDAALAPVTADVTYKATYTKTWQITFENWNGDVLEQDEVEDGALPSYDAIPSRPGDADYTYTFKGWDKEIVAADKDATYTATYTAIPIDPALTCTLTLTPKPADGGKLTGGGTYRVGTLVMMTATPSEGYVFENWTIDASEQSDRRIYILRMTSDLTLNGSFDRLLTVRWLDGDEQTVLQEKTYNEGADEPEYTGDTPTKAATQQYTYEFSGWDSGTVSDTVKTYQSQFNATTNKYSVTFVDEKNTGDSSLCSITRFALLS